MIYNVAQLLRQHIGATRQCVVGGELTDIDQYNPGPLPVEGQVTLIRTDAGILAMGTVALSIVRPCRRCLEFSQGRVTIRFEEEFVPSIDIETGRSLDARDAEPELVISDEHLLDLRGILHQYVVMETLEGALCSQDCKGLCPVCGKNLNEGDCGCQRGYIDPRWEALTQLLPGHTEAE